MDKIASLQQELQRASELVEQYTTSNEMLVQQGNKTHDKAGIIKQSLDNTTKTIENLNSSLVDIKAQLISAKNMTSLTKFEQTCLQKELNELNRVQREWVANEFATSSNILTADIDELVTRGSQSGSIDSLILIELTDIKTLRLQALERRDHTRQQMRIEKV